MNGMIKIYLESKKEMRRKFNTEQLQIIDAAIDSHCDESVIARVTNENLSANRMNLILTAVIFEFTDEQLDEISNETITDADAQIIFEYHELKNSMRRSSSNMDNTNYRPTTTKCCCK